MTQDRKEYLRLYRLKNKDKIKQYRLNHIEEAKRYRLKNKEEINQHQHEYYLKNKERRKEYFRLHRKKRDSFYNLIHHTLTIKVCDICGKAYLIEVHKTKVKLITNSNHGGKKHYCSKQCKNRAQSIISKGKKPKNFEYFLRGGIKSRYNRGKNHYNWKGGLPHCLVCGKRLSVRSAKYCWHHNGVPRSGSKNHFWKGGITPLYERIRRLGEYKTWRKKVYKRDNYTCQICGIKGSWNKKTKQRIILNADHFPLSFIQIIKIEKIKKPSDIKYRSILWNINNGRILCESCHKRTDNYGQKKSSFMNKQKIVY